MLILKSLLILLAVLWLALFVYFRNPSFVFQGQTNTLISPQSLQNHVRQLTGIVPTRYYKNLSSMTAAEEYIKTSFEKMGYQVQMQEVPADGHIYHNIIARYGDKDAKELIVIGAHYDTADYEIPGADDNASGVAALLEIANLFMSQKIQVKTAVEFVSYTLEEPFFSDNKRMGSAVHAKDLKNRNINVKLMICLEMLGFYSNDFFSQKYPIPLLHLLYPSRGNFIALVSNPESRQEVKNLKDSMAHQMSTPVYSISISPDVTGIDFSDHRNYWRHKWPAIMVTDTAFYRNENYHRPEDTDDTLDYKIMADVVGGLFEGVSDLAEH